MVSPRASVTNLSGSWLFGRKRQSSPSALPPIHPMSSTNSSNSSAHPLSASVYMEDVDADAEFLTEAEQAFFIALQELGVRFLIVGMSAALLQSARGSTEDIDIWFDRLDDERIAEAARRAGGIMSFSTEQARCEAHLHDGFSSSQAQGLRTQECSASTPRRVGGFHAGRGVPRRT